MEVRSELPNFFYQNLAAGSQDDGRLQRSSQHHQQQQQHPQQHQAYAHNQQSTNASLHGQSLYPSLPRGAASSSTYMQGSLRGRSSMYQQAGGSHSQSALPPPSTDNLKPIPRAARTVNDYLSQETRYPELDNILTQGQSSDYELNDATDWAPFVRTNMFDIPDQIFEQYNQVQVMTKMGLFAEIGRAWITVDNRLYLWSFSSGEDFQCFDEQPNSILSVKLVKPRPGVFVDSVTHVLLIATTHDIMLLGVSAVPNGKSANGRDVTIYNTKMSVPVKGINVNVMEGSEVTGRIFFSGTGDNEVYELTYQEQEGWFSPRCGKVCHTQSSIIAQFAPKISFLGGQTRTENTTQMVIDDTRGLLYTLSSHSTIRTFHIKAPNTLNLLITYTLAHTLSNIRVMIGPTPLLGQSTQLVSISAVSSQEARRTHLIATSSTGCRLYFSAISSDYSSLSPPSSMQVIHVRFPPATESTSNPGQFNPATSRYLLNTRRASVFPPGYFLCFVDSTGEKKSDQLFVVTPDSARIALMAESPQIRPSLTESGHWIDLDSRAEDVQLITPPFSAAPTPSGFGNEMAVQFEKPSTEIAILTNNGVHIVRRRRYIEILASAIKFGASSSQSQGAEGEAMKFLHSYGRTEFCAAALAIACGVLSADSFDSRATGKVTDVEITDLARRFFIENGGTARVFDNELDSNFAPSLDNVQVSARHNGMALYISRIVRSIWKVPIISQTAGAGGVVTHSSNAPLPKLQVIQEQLTRLSEFLNDNRALIDGLSGPETLMRAGSRAEEVAHQAEHRALHSLTQLIAAMIEGISFAIVLFEDKLDDIIALLPDNVKASVMKLTYEGLFTSDEGKDIARELVTAIVNRNISAGSSVDTVAEALRRRCGSFCSADDVVTFKAIEHLRRAKETADVEGRYRALRESERLFEQVAETLTTDNLREAVAEFQGLQFYAGAIRLALSVAKESDRGNAALAYLVDNMPASDSRKEYYDRRMQCYSFVFNVLEAVEASSQISSDEIDGVMTFEGQLRQEARDVVDDSDDQVFQSAYYDWLFSRGMGARLIESESAGIVPYLKRKAVSSLDHADLLWQYYSRWEHYFEAAFVLRDLANSAFPEVTLERRIEYLSRARNFCNCYCPFGTRQQMNELLQKVQEEIDVTMIQDDILRRVKADKRISESKVNDIIKQLDAKMMTLSDLFNRFADPYDYSDICLSIFQVADYRGTHEIKQRWSQLIKQTHDMALQDDENGKHSWESVSDIVRSLGQRFQLSEYIFPADDLVPMLELYALEKQPSSLGQPWVPQTFLDAGVNPELLVRVLDGMFFRDETPFRGQTRKRLVRDAVYVVEQWLKEALKNRGQSSTFGRNKIAGAFKKDMVLEMFTAYKQVLQGVQDEKLRKDIERIENEIRRIS